MSPDHPSRRARIYRLSPEEMAAVAARAVGRGLDGDSMEHLAARGLGVGMAGADGSRQGPPPLPAGLELPATSYVVGVSQWRNGDYSIRIACPDWPLIPPGDPYPLARTPVEE